MRDGKPTALGIYFEGAGITATNVQDAIIEVYGSAAGFNPANAFIVAESGTSYTSIKTAVDAANLVATASDPQVVLVYPGQYTEDPMTLNAYVHVVGVGLVEVVKNNDVTNLFTLNTDSRVHGLEITGPTSAGAFSSVASANRSVVRNCKIKSGLYGIFSDQSNSFTFVEDVIFESSLDHSIRCEDGRIVTVNTTDESQDGLECVGASSIVNMAQVSFKNNSIAIFADDGARVIGQSVKTESVGTNISTGTNTPTVTRVEISGFQVIEDSSTLDLNQQGVGTQIIVANGFLNRAKILAVDWSSISAVFYDNVEGDESFKVVAELHVGTPERPVESVFGQGDSYTVGMVVLTTDSTATSTTDGGNITDVSAAAASFSGSTFSFQGTAANHTILLGSERIFDSDVVKHWGIKSTQTTAASLVLSTDQPFVFEYWNGSAWTAFDVQSTNSSDYYSYANNIFLRANSSEQIRFGLTEADTAWAKKTINSQNLYWIRIRIDIAVATAPVFQQFKLHTSRFEINAEGINEYFGNARFRKTLISSGNIFGESGGVASTSVSVGTGVAPTGWNHQIKNSLFNGSGDAIMVQFLLPKGIDTSLPLNFRMVYLATSTDPTPVSLILSVLALGVEGNLIADVAGGGVLPIPRATGEDKNGKAAQTNTQSELMNSTSVLKQVEFTGFSVADYYAGDAIFVRLEGDVMNTADFIVVALEVSNVSAVNGEAI